jgi:hypothetical protein
LRTLADSAFAGVVADWRIHGYRMPFVQNIWQRSCSS